MGPLVRELRADLDKAPPGPRASRIRTTLRELSALDETLAGYAERCGLAVHDNAPGTTAGSPMERRTRALVAEWSLRPATRAAVAPGNATRTATATDAPRTAPGPGPVTDTETAGVTVAGTVRCAAHPAGCAGWITVIDARGKRVAAGPVRSGRYLVDGLRAGSHTLIVSATSHAPHAEFLYVPESRETGRIGHDMRL